MKIKEFSINRYGPLPETGRMALSNFNLFFGKNEEGKTLMIDALVKLLLGKSVKGFEHINRVEESPEGYIVLENGYGKEVKVPEMGGVEEVTGLSPSECRNIFIVRDSDLSILRQSEFYTNVTDHLTGLRTEEITSIKKELQKLGKLTRADSKGELSDKQEFGKMKSRVDSARDLIEIIDRFQDSIEREHFERFEEELVMHNRSLENVREKIECFETARKREKYEKGKKALEKFTEEEQSQEAEKLRKEGQCLQALKDKKRMVDEAIGLKIAGYRAKKEKAAGQEVMNRFFAFAATISPVLLVLSLVGNFLIASLVLFNILTVLFLILTVIFWGCEFFFLKSRARLAEEVEKIKSDASNLGLGAGSIEEILAAAGEIEKECLDREEQLNEKKEKERQFMGTQIGVLKSFFAEKGKTLEDNIRIWREEVKKLEIYRDKAKGIEFDENAVSGSKAEEETHRNKLDEINRKMSELRMDMEEVEREANKALKADDYLYCGTSAELKTVRDRLQMMITENETNKSTALKVMELFEKIESEEKDKISELFGKGSSVSKRFEGITGGLYKEVTFESEMGEIEVKRRDGEMLEARKLSGGAYDQLYLSVRVALGERLLKSEKGFFIMDDPFIKADPGRLNKLIYVLKEISEDGWQVIYFTAKGEIVKSFKEDINCGKINYAVIPGILVE